MKEIIIAGELARSEAAECFALRREEFEKHFSPFFCRLLEAYTGGLPEASGRVEEILRISRKAGIVYGAPLFEGLLAGLWTMAETLESGLTADLYRFPLRQEAVEILELCGRDPYEADSRDAVLLVSERGPEVISALREAGIPAVTVGRLAPPPARTIVRGDHVRWLDKPRRRAVQSPPIRETPG